ncbi:hypothetical protein F0342_14390 [Bacillus sp. CH30_1T]|uniref:hypothetical protein n=1 Tax=Bacillus sp. CH30_1T TaxID=2604836 RepID=UPI0011EF9148|nr:hypothetical protein [Bacillus sp. CH30_1T]KAA0563204.1 hypothetical protein F0342_14390 [Bacillus sp. CH30_1T]
MPLPDKQEVLQDNTYSVKHLYQMTLPQPMIDTDLKISTTFMERYPKNPEDGLPQPTVAIKMASEAKEKSKVVGAYSGTNGRCTAFTFTR